MTYREQRGGLEESMLTCAYYPSMADLCEALIDRWGPGKIETFHQGWDARIEWDTYVVLHNNRAVGFINAPEGLWP